LFDAILPWLGWIARFAFLRLLRLAYFDHLVDRRLENALDAEDRVAQCAARTAPHPPPDPPAPVHPTRDPVERVDTEHAEDEKGE
jgi:hypothetical protein